MDFPHLFDAKQDALVDTLVDRGDVGDDSGADARLLSGARKNGDWMSSIGMIHGYSWFFI